MGKRKFGHYWVMYDGDWFVGEYELDKDGSGMWWVCGFPEYFDETELQKVDELMIPKHI